MEAVKLFNQEVREKISQSNAFKYLCQKTGIFLFIRKELKLDKFQEMMYPLHDFLITDIESFSFFY